jgi:hypothetical protein
MRPGSHPKIFLLRCTNNENGRYIHSIVGTLPHFSKLHTNKGIKAD